MRLHRILRCFTGVIVFALLAVSHQALAQTNQTTTVENKMPSDIDPQSGFRLPLPKREDLDEVGQRAYDRALTSAKSIVGQIG